MSSLLLSSGLRRAFLLAVVLGVGACALNPQPEDPFVEPPVATGGTMTPPEGGTGNSSLSTGGLDALGGAGTGGGGMSGVGGIGTGGTGTGGAAVGGMSATGGMMPGTAGSFSVGGAASGGAGGDTGITGCVGEVEAALIDDVADCDADVFAGTGRSGAWFAYDSGPELPGILEPAPGGDFVMTPARDDCAARVSGGGYPDSDTNGHGYAGIGLSLGTLDGEPCSEGYDARSYSGLSFAALGPGQIRVIVETVATASSTGRPNGYAAVLELSSTWVEYTLGWDDLTLIDLSGGAPVVLDPRQVRTIRFAPVDPTAFEFWIDDVAFSVPPTGAGGAAGAGGEGGQGGGRTAGASSAGAAGAARAPTSGAGGAG